MRRDVEYLSMNEQNPRARYPAVIPSLHVIPCSLSSHMGSRSWRIRSSRSSCIVNLNLDWDTYHSVSIKQNKTNTAFKNFMLFICLRLACSVAQTVLKLMILLSQSPDSWYYRHTPTSAIICYILRVILNVYWIEILIMFLLLLLCFLFVCFWNSLDWLELTA